jgi:hypothetical protein
LKLKGFLRGFLHNVFVLLLIVIYDLRAVILFLILFQIVFLVSIFIIRSDQLLFVPLLLCVASDDMVLVEIFARELGLLLLLELVVEVHIYAVFLFILFIFLLLIFVVLISHLSVVFF